jgi:hypothetical protein
VTLNGCSSGLSNQLTVILTGVETIGKEPSVSVYPNPVSDELIIEKSGNTKNLKFEIFNSSGQVVYSGNLTDKTIVQTAGFSKGFYIIRIENGINYDFKKIIKD